jgi:hypothetical protein
MIGLRAAKQNELTYAFRRVLYDMMIAAKSLASLSQVTRDYSRKESMKIAALIMARNLSDFFFQHQYRYYDDINVTDFALTTWRPDNTAKLTPSVKRRIDKIAGHIVASKPAPFKEDQEVSDFVLPLVAQAREFVRACRAEQKAEYTGHASKYRRKLDGILPQIGLPKLPKT